MSMSDPIADMLTRMRNAILREHASVIIPFSRIKENVAKVLLSEGYILGYSKQAAKVGEDLLVELKYDQKEEPVIRSIQRVSKPGLRVHKKYTELKPLLNGQGVYVVSTSQGLLTDADCRAKKVGGEVICSVY